MSDEIYFFDEKETFLMEVNEITYNAFGTKLIVERMFNNNNFKKILKKDLFYFPDIEKAYLICDTKLSENNNINEIKCLINGAELFGYRNKLDVFWKKEFTEFQLSPLSEFVEIHDYGKPIGNGLAAKRDIKEGERFYSINDPSIFVPDEKSFNQMEKCYPILVPRFKHFAYHPHTVNKLCLEISIASWMNHSREPNAGYDPKDNSKGCFFRDIKKGEQIFEDYTEYLCPWLKLYDFDP